MAGRGQERGSRRPPRRTIMTQMEILAPSRTTPNGYKVDVSRGQRIGRVSSEWFNRPDDERYLSLTDLNKAVKRRSEAVHLHHERDPRRASRQSSGQPMPPDATRRLPYALSFGQSPVGRRLPPIQFHRCSTAGVNCTGHHAPRGAGEDPRDRERPPRAPARRGLRAGFSTTN